jgi:uncharacterized membrane protein
MTNIVLTIIALVIVALLVFIAWHWAKRRARIEDDDEIDTFAKVLELVKARIIELDRDEYDADPSSPDFTREYEQ